MRGGLQTRERRATRRVLVTTVVLVVAIGAVRAEAADDEAPGGAGGVGDLADATLVLEHLDGDHVVHRVLDVHSDDDREDHVAGKGTGEGNGPVVHDGFTTYADAVALTGYEILLVSSSGIEQMRPAISRAANAAVAASSPSLVLGPGTIDPASRPDRGQIHVRVSSSSPCRGSWLGCGGPIIEDGVVVAGQIWINPRLLERDGSQIDNASRHELGHALGLGHYNWLHEGRTQSMHGSSFDAVRYESGDRAGLRFISGNDGPAVEATPATPAAAPRPPQARAVNPSGATDVVGSGPFGLVIRGWASDPDSSWPVSVLVTVDGAPFEALANRARPDGSTNGFEIVAAAVPPGVHEVCVLLRNGGAGADTRLGCQVVEVSDRSIGRVGIQTV